jgi:hypothetical protein
MLLELNEVGSGVLYRYSAPLEILSTSSSDCAEDVDVPEVSSSPVRSV